MMIINIYILHWKYIASVSIKNFVPCIEKQSCFSLFFSIRYLPLFSFVKIRNQYLQMSGFRFLLFYQKLKYSTDPVGKKTSSFDNSVILLARYRECKASTCFCFLLNSFCLFFKCFWEW